MIYSYILTKQNEPRKIRQKANIIKIYNKARNGVENEINSNAQNRTTIRKIKQRNKQLKRKRINLRHTERSKIKNLNII